jgi:hypothetical protein
MINLLYNCKRELVYQVLREPCRILERSPKELIVRDQERLGKRRIPFSSTTTGCAVLRSRLSARSIAGPAKSSLPSAAGTASALRSDDTDARSEARRCYGRSDRRAQRAGPPTKLAGGRDRPADRSPAGRPLRKNKEPRLIPWVPLHPRTSPRSPSGVLGQRRAARGLRICARGAPDECQRRSLPATSIRPTMGDGRPWRRIVRAAGLPICRGRAT